VRIGRWLREDSQKQNRAWLQNPKGPQPKVMMAGTSITFARRRTASPIRANLSLWYTQRPIPQQSFDQCAIKTGKDAFAKMCRVAPPKIICRNRLWV